MGHDCIVPEIRSFNRFYTNVLGLLNQHILDSTYSLTEVRILLEIDKTPDCTANTLIDKLDIDRGYMSRILKRFEADGLITKESSLTDARRVFLSLTEKGKQTLSILEGKSDNQIQKLIGHLTEIEKEKLTNAMGYIKDALSSGLNPVIIRPFQTAEDIEYIIKRHRELYDSEYGFSPVFGNYVADAVYKFAECHDDTKENIWIAEANGVPAGVIALVKVDDSTAQLRWFLLEPEMRGKGLGHRLMKTVIDFCREAGYTHILLWTVNILEAARHLYKSYGFKISETHENDEWSKHPIIEERWDLDL